MTTGERLAHLQADLDYYEDMFLINTDSYSRQHIEGIIREIALVRQQQPIQPQTQSQTQPQTQPQTQTQTQPQTRPETQPQTLPQQEQCHPSG